MREGPWKLIVDPGSGGWTPLGMRFRGEKDKSEALDRSDVPPMGLYNVEQDPGEYNNLLEQQPEIARDLIAQLKEIIADGRSTPGAGERGPSPKNPLPVRRPLSQALAPVGG